MFWKTFYCFFVLPSTNDMSSMSSMMFTEIPKPSSSLPLPVDVVFKPNKKQGGYDERPIIVETDPMYNITMNHWKMKLLKRLESKNVSIYEKLECMRENKWLFDSPSPDYTTNLLAGKLMDDW